MPIKLLSDATINKIAAGEVVERPLSVIKELVENALDAKASNIKVYIERGGRNLISVVDDGIGIDRDELELSVTRHATSKLDESSLEDITFMGFRGEALPSIAAVSRMTISSRTENSNTGWAIRIEGDKKNEAEPIARLKGTTVEVRDLFCFTPNRVKFLKAESTESGASIDMVNRFALSFPEVGFQMYSNDKRVINFEKNANIAEELKFRATKILGKDFIDNSIYIDQEHGPYHIYGYLALPTYNRSTIAEQYYFVNKRIVKDKFLAGITKAVYRNLLPAGRHPAVVLFIELPFSEVDVNVHPNKTEVRFKNEAELRQKWIPFLRNKIADAYHQASSANTANQHFQIENSNVKSRDVKSNLSMWAPSWKEKPRTFNTDVDTYKRELNSPALNFTGSEAKIKHDADGVVFSDISASKVNVKEEASRRPGLKDSTQEPGITQGFKVPPLGYAKCQIKNTYIIAENEEELVIVDQHAAHERLVLEEMKTQYERGGIPSQALLIPEVISLNEAIVHKLAAHAEFLKKFGFVIEKNGSSQVAIREIPVVLKQANLKELVQDIVAHIDEYGSSHALEEKIDYICGNIACKSSIKAGKKLSIEEMNAILRKMEQTTFAGQCNHGRPTYIKLSHKDISSIFERS